MKLKNTYLLPLILMSVTVFSCSKNVMDEASELESFDFQKNLFIETIPIEKSLKQFSEIDNDLKRIDTINPIGLRFNLNSIRHKPLTNHSAKVTVTDVQTKYPELKSQAWQTKLNGEEMAVIVHLFKSGVDDVGSDYNGLLIYTDDLGNVLSLYKIQNGKTTSELKIPKTITQRTGKDIIKPCWGIACGITLDEIVLTPPNNNQWNYIPININISYANVYQNYLNNSYISYASGYSSYVSNYVVYSPDNPINDIRDYLKCFDINKSAKITIYADQPKPNSSDAYINVGSIFRPQYVVGHTFVSIEQGGNTSVFGFYPDGDPDPFNRSMPGIFGNDQREVYDVSISRTVSGSTLQRILNTTYNYTNSQYDLNTKNCTDFGITIGNIAGLKLPQSDGTWLGGGGSNPGALGENMRKNNTTGIKKNLSGGNAPTNKKGC
ncbi:hypothetical protein J0X14_09415 [Muricauda sp. CAU 1633]|uniref:hypothetical protein n=1 Tax=Allomuricauda sp. CAU 1633 TaxID=2816036 RepID=UPI001A8D0E06|nr:hypothetical protein [Muricauda sp. CAU 1633]MBO0322516.1 hypothetical protein [Muricauda sp. CAU 1633]